MRHAWTVAALLLGAAACVHQRAGTPAPVTAVSPAAAVPASNPPASAAEAAPVEAPPAQSSYSAMAAPPPSPPPQSATAAAAPEPPAPTPAPKAVHKPAPTTTRPTAPGPTLGPAPSTAKGSPPAAAAPAAAAAQPTLDLTSLEQRLRDTRAIGVFTKLSLKNQVDDLLQQFKAFHAGQSKASLAQLREEFELLLLKVVSLLQDGDAPLAAAVSSSREAIWGVLADPRKFAQI